MVVVARLDAIRVASHGLPRRDGGPDRGRSPGGSKPARAGASMRDDEEARRKRMGQRPKQKQKQKQKLMLWWCWTEDHHEDWFVVAGHGVAAVATSQTALAAAEEATLPRMRCGELDLRCPVEPLGWQ